MAFNVYVVMLIWPLRMLGMILAQAQRAVASSERVAEVLATAPEVVDPARPVRLPPGGGDVRFDNVTFRYPSAVAAAPVLDGLDLHVAAGESVALVGATGCGKTTVARLIPRFYDVDSGSVRMDGVDVRELRLAELRGAVGIVFEDTFLFNDTIARQHRVRVARCAAGAGRASGPPGRRPRLHRAAARRLRHRDRRAGLLAVGRAAAAHRHRPGDPRRPPGA